MVSGSFLSPLSLPQWQRPHPGNDRRSPPSHGCRLSGLRLCCLRPWLPSPPPPQPCCPAGMGLGCAEGILGSQQVCLLAGHPPERQATQASPGQPCSVPPRSEATPHPCSGSQSTLLRFLVLGGFGGTALDRPLQTALSVRGDEHGVGQSLERGTWNPRLHEVAVWVQARSVIALWLPFLV